MQHLKHWRYPETLPEALDLLARGGSETMAVAGATALSLNLPASVETLVDITRIKELSGVQVGTDGSLTIGATTSARQLVESMERLSQDHPVITALVGSAAQVVGSRLIRNVVTVGGNLVQLFAWSDLPVALLALDAQVECQQADGGPRTLSAQELFQRHPRNTLKRGELLTYVHIPPFGDACGGGFTKFARTAVDHSLANAAVSLRLDSGGLVAAARVAISGCLSRPLRVTQAEDLLVGEPPTEDRIGQVAAIIKNTIEPMPDYRASADYRRQVAATLVVRLLNKAADEARGTTH